MFIDCGKEVGNKSECERKRERRMIWKYRREKICGEGVFGLWGRVVRRSCFREEERELNVSIVEVRKEVINWFILL